MSFRIRFICCGREQKPDVFRETWEEADALRRSYAEVVDSGHERVAIVENATPESPAPQSAGLSEREQWERCARVLGVGFTPWCGGPFLFKRFRDGAEFEIPDELRDRILALADEKEATAARLAEVERSREWNYTASQRRKAQVAELRATLAEVEEQNDELRRELSEISAAIGRSEFMDPPDGGSVGLGEQVRRMRNRYDRALAMLREFGPTLS